LALIQANLVVDAFRRSGQASHVAIIETDGDRRAPDTAWGEGAFVAAIEQALLDGRVDVAVHSAKDVPTDGDSRLRIGAYLPRADPRDALVVRADATARQLDDLPVGSRVGTDSPRRTGFILARRPDLRVHPLHGNVDTRLRRLDTGETDALVLACAGLDRLGLAGRIVQRLDPDVVPPAPGQGAIAVQIRCDDPRLSVLAGAIDDRQTRILVETERSFLEAFGGGCRTPIGALATISNGELELLGGVATADGSRAQLLRRHGSTESGSRLAGEVARSLGAAAPVPARIQVNPIEATPKAPRVIVCRAADQAAELVLALRDAGLDPLPIPTIAVELEPAGGALDDAVRRLDRYTWVVITSTNSARAIVNAGARGVPAGRPRWAAIGQATGTVLEAAGIEVSLQPSQASGRTIAAELPVTPGERVLVVRGDLAGPDLGLALGARGALVDDVVAYRTREAHESSGRLLGQAVAEGPIAALVFTSGSTVRGLVSIATTQRLDVTRIPAVCIGPRTAAEARAAGFNVIGVSAMPEATALAATVAQALDVLPAAPRSSVGPR
jgi:hydroxymethylbilane synthase